MRYLKHLWICLLLAPLGMAQVSNPSITIVASPPSGSCSSNLPDQQVAITGALYSCQSGTWAEISGGSGGSGFPITLGSTSIAASSTTTAVAGLVILNGLSFDVYNTGTYNVGGAILSNTAALYSTATGFGALAAGVTGVNDTAYGYNAMGVYTGTNGSGQNSAFGTNSLGSLINGVGNEDYGEGSQYNMLYGSANTVMGFEALQLWGGAGSSTTTSNGGNTVIGYLSAKTCVTGCGAGFASGDQNVYIGAEITPYTNGVTNELVLSAGITGAGRGSNTSTIGNSSTTSFLAYGTQSVSGPAPSVSSNAGTGSLTDGNDNAGIIATGVASTATTLTFGTGWGTWSSCVVSASTATAQPYVSAISNTAVTFTYVTTGTPHLYYVCLGA